jgi:hypothetical protein
MDDVSEICIKSDFQSTFLQILCTLPEDDPQKAET